MKTLKIDREKLEEVTKSAVREMLDFEWSGWKIDILIDEEGEITCSSKNTNNVYMYAHVLFSVSEWSTECSYMCEDNEAIDQECSEYIRYFEQKDLGYLTELEEKYNIEFID